MPRNRSGIKRFFQIAILIILVIMAIFLLASTIKLRQAINETVTNINDNETISIPETPIILSTDEKSTLSSDKKKEESETPTTFIDHDVPFATQAPTGQWSDQRQQDGCEEASALMAIRWIKNQKLTKEEALQEIIALSDYEQAMYGEYRDVSLADVKSWIFEDYYKYSNVRHVRNISKEDIISALYDDSVVLLPMNGQLLGNPYFSQPGPERHMLLVRGYDPQTDQFITNDPGTRRGEGYRYSSKTIMDAILVYPTGYHNLADENLKEMLVVKK